MRRRRTFAYEGEQVEMFRHLKIGIEANVAKTIRVHFHWDSERENIVIGYCGEHLSVAMKRPRWGSEPRFHKQRPIERDRLLVADSTKV
jgi:hypothetical protein